jgi:PadR family transcriptional regulator PadR
MSSDRIRGHLNALLLAVLADGPAHGYAATKALRERTQGGVSIPEGSLYPALHRLEEQGLIESSWDEESSRRRRLYALTRQGKETLAAEVEEWRSFRDMIDAVLGSSHEG